MVIGVEGNVHVGKTTFIKDNFGGCNIIKETDFNKKLNDYDRQLYYIDKEKQKKSLMNGNTILDRTILSIIIYTLYSGALNKNDKNKVMSLINDCIDKKSVIIPDEIYLILYPYKLSYSNHQELSKLKGTQDCLVDYEYYLKYYLYFSNRYKSFKRIYLTNNYRQVLIYGKTVFNNISDLKINSKVLLDGCPAIGKSTIGMKQKKYNYIEEFKYQKYSLDDYSNQINSIVERINYLNNSNVILDTSFLMGITHMFYNEEAPKSIKLKMIDEIIGRVQLNCYITKIIYLVLDKYEIIKRKENDKQKPRKHFYNNLKYLDSEINFYKVLNKKLGKLSNIKFLDASYSVDKLVDMVEKTEEKPLLLIDLFYEIKEAIKEGEL